MSAKTSAAALVRGSAEWATLVVTGPDALATLTKLVNAHWEHGESVAIDGRILFRPTAGAPQGKVVELVSRTDRLVVEQP